jgi:hypothetical protein
MSGGNMQLPADVTILNLTPAEAATQQELRRQAAAIDGVAVSFQQIPQPDGRVTLNVHFAPLPAAGRAAPASALPPINAPTPVPSPQGKGGQALSAAHWQSTLDTLGNPDEALLWALIKQESETMTGFLPDRRPIILYERHVFARNSNNRFDQSHPDISGPQYKPDEYGSLDNQYLRLIEAMALDHAAALMAASWGLGQTLGEGAVEIGYASVDALVAQMQVSEDLQLDAIVAEISKKNAVQVFKNRANGLKDFARLYNGTGRVDGYASELTAKFDEFRTKGLPDLPVRTAQMYLTYQKEKPGPIDGVLGNTTRGALLSFQAKQGLPGTGVADIATLDRLEALLFPA